MHITEMKIITVDAVWRNWVFVKLFTDEGLSGVGEGTTANTDLQVVGALRRFREYLVGQDPFDIERHWTTMYYGSHWRGVAVYSALGAIEQALWDIVGKALEVPVYKLLGGRCRDRIRAYTHVSEGTRSVSPDQRADEARQAVAEGWTALKWNPFPGNLLSMDRDGLRYVERSVAAVREAVGEDVEILVEVHGRLNVKTAIEVAARLKPYRPYFMEEPVPPEGLDALAKVAAGVEIPLATGERLCTRYQYWPLLERQLVSYIQPDVIHVGGIMEAKKIASMAETRYIEVAPHNSNGPVATAATIQLVSNIPNFAMQEMPGDDYKRGASWRDEIVMYPIEVVDGYIEVPDRPGLGVELNDEAISKHPPKDPRFRISYVL